MYKGTVCKVILIGYMEGVPTIHTASNGKQILSFFITRIRPLFEKNNQKAGDKMEWYRVYVENENASYIEKFGRPGMRITVHGNATNCGIETTATSEFIVTEIFAEKVFFFSSDNLHQNIIFNEMTEYGNTNRISFLSDIVSSRHIAYTH